MSWSARELGELAGTSRRTVRHYQQLGLLNEPERGANGYQHYDVTHLIRLLRIRRLSELGLPLAMIRDLGEVEEHPTEALRSLRLELDASITRLEGLRDELDYIVARASPIEVPIDLDEITRDLSRADRVLTVILSRMLGPEALRAWKGLLGPYRGAPAVVAFDSLTEDASAEERRNVASALARHMEDLADEMPEAFAPILIDLGRHSGVRKSIDAALPQLYNDAQREVLKQASAEIAPTLRTVMTRR